MRHDTARDNLEALGHGRDRRSPVSLHDRNNRVFPLTNEALAFLQHRVGLSNAGGSAEQYS